MPLTSAWLPQAAKPRDIRQRHRLHKFTWISGFIAAWDGSMNHRNQRGLWWHHGASGHLRRSNPESKLVLISGLHHCSRPENPVAEQQVWGLSPHELQAVGHHRLSLLGNNSM